MPLTVLITVVLPAPLGPMTETSSRSPTARSTSLTAWTPPKCFDNPSTCSSIPLSPLMMVTATLRQPALAAPIMLHVPIALPLAHPGQPQIELLDVLVLADRARFAVEDDPAALHHVGVLGEPQRHRGVLLGQEDGQALLPVEPGDDLEDLP